MISALAAIAAPILFGAALRSLVAAVAVWAGLRLLRVRNVVVQKTAWGLVLAASLAMPFLSRWQLLPAWAHLHLPAFMPNPAPSVAASAQTPSDAPEFPASSSISDLRFDQPDVPAVPVSEVPQRPAPSARSHMYPASQAPAAASKSKPADVKQDSVPIPALTQPRTQTPIRTLPRLAAWLALLYLGVAAALLLRLLLGIATALHLWKTAEPILLNPELDLDGPSRVRSSQRVASPVNIASGIILPADYGSWDDEKMRIVLAHERSHIRQRDFYLQILAGLYACVFWFSPLGWWLKRKLYELAEAISDRAGLEEAASRISYAQLLLEFAVFPRPTLTGVAMARTNHLSQRIERLLNESSFRQAFSGCGLRALAAVTLVPVALIGATALVRVEAATPPAQPQTGTPTIGQSVSTQVTDQAPATPAPAPAPAAESAPAPAAPQAPAAEPAPEATPQPKTLPLPPSGAMPAPAPVSPLPPSAAISAEPPIPPMPPIQVGPMNLHVEPRFSSGYRFALDFTADDSDPYVIVESDGRVMKPSGRFSIDSGAHGESIEKARKMAHGAFLWFKHDGKAYIVEDSAIVAQVEAMDKPIEDIRNQMQDLGKQMRELGEQQRALGKQMRDVNVPTPDLSKEIADLNAAAEQLKAKQGGTITQKELGDLQREIGHIMGQLGSLQGKIGTQQGNLGGQMGTYGGEMGKLGGQMGQLGAKMGQVARENQAKMKGIISESLSNGKAKPVE